MTRFLSLRRTGEISGYLFARHGISPFKGRTSGGNPDSNFIHIVLGLLAVLNLLEALQNLFIVLSAGESKIAT
jgi:hypothetical protein